MTHFLQRKKKIEEKHVWALVNIQQNQHHSPPPESCSHSLTDHDACLSQRKETTPFPSTPTPWHSFLGRFSPLFCATFRLCLSLSDARDVSKLPPRFTFFTFTSSMRLSCCSTTSNGVYCSALGNLCFEWSEHEMMQGQRCVGNLNRDVCRCSLLCRLLSLCFQFPINSAQ